MRIHFGEGIIITNRYKVECLLGEGTMGAVYLCEDLEVNGKVVVLKEMSLKYIPSFLQEQILTQFKKEIQILSFVMHPNIPYISHFFQYNDYTYFLVMDFVEGRNLTQILIDSGGSLKENNVVRWALQICDVLNYLHNKWPLPIIHGDLKPSNIMLTPEGKIKIIDFGIARFYCLARMDEDHKMGSFGFSPPEKFRERIINDVRSDIYSFGATMHFLLTNRDPQAHLPFSYPPPRTLNPELSLKIDRIIMKALSYEKENRYESVSEMKKDLEKDDDFFWKNSFFKSFLKSDFAAKFLLNPEAGKKKISVLIVLLSILFAVIVIDSVKIHTMKRAELKRSLSNLYFINGQQLQSKALYLQALFEYRKAMEIDRNDVRSAYNSALIYMTMKQYDEAEKLMKRVIRKDSRFVPALRDMGILYYYKNNLDKASDYVRRALKMAPSDGISHYYQGLIYEKKGRLVEAIMEYQIYIEKIPNDSEKEDIQFRINSLRDKMD